MTSGDRKALLKRLSKWIVDAAPTHPLRVGIDGPDGAGKSVLADELAALVGESGRPVIRASIDGFHRSSAQRVARYGESPEGYYRDSFDHTALRQSLLEPLGPEGDLSYRVAVFDFRADRRIKEGWKTSDRNAVLLFDGVFLLRPELRNCWDIGVYLHVEWDEVLRRVTERDSKWMGSQEEVRERYLNRYIPGQQLYLEEVRPADGADVVIDNSDLHHPLFVHEWTQES